MKLTNATNGDEIQIVFNPIIWCRLIKPKYLHDDNVNLIINATTLVMMKNFLN